jgi:transcriptional regulator with XRE-family HTH domain
MKERSGESMGKVLRNLMAERGLSMRELARRVQVDQAHLSRIISGPEPKPASGRLAARVAEALDLPAEYFPEARRARVIELIDEDPDLRDRLYDRYARQR